MNRLLQGEVGSGKTAVAAAIAAAELAQGGQVAIMAPTEILARQHRAFFSDLGEKLGFTVNWFGGDQTKAERAPALESLALGQPSISVGTQALCSESVVFTNLTLAIIDEQHRFGVRQRLLLRNKCPKVNLLAMTATPIPASLAAILYGDLDISSMRGLPPGRRLANTHVYKPSALSEAYAFMASLVGQGQRAFVVCPRIAGSDPDGAADEWDNDYAQSDSTARPAATKGASARPEATKVVEDIRTLLPGLRVGLLHGRMSHEEKLKAMSEFREGRTSVLVSTSMIEVGVDVPEANVMLVAGANFFGLSQLHQLRGRVGRGGGQGHFLLVPTLYPSQIAQTRLEALKTMTDGYELADLDLKLRGPGEELGLRQSGWPKLFFAKFPKDMSNLAAAMELAQDLWLNRHLWGPELAECVRLEGLALSRV
jgi:ATP-dependent DNA helicase RecG